MGAAARGSPHMPSLIKEGLYGVAMKKIITVLLIIAIAVTSISLFACTDSEEQETGHNIIVGDDDEGDVIAPTDQESDDDSWELGGVPLG